VHYKENAVTKQLKYY